MNYCGLNVCDTANGPGIRVSLFVSGCTVQCKYCFNKESWDFNAGKPFTEQTKQTILNALQEEYIEGFSLLGGDPFEREHESCLVDLLADIKNRYPNKTIWCWTGRIYDTVKDSPLLKYVDYLVDGPYVPALKAEHKWYGSNNQKIIKIR